ncbi:MAG: hypothetical protein KDA61_16910, partial [Planctomycetales bacterium]|nr:hypothetical protein [Planctomycetales bacterium]
MASALPLSSATASACPTGETSQDASQRAAAHYDKTYYEGHLLPRAQAAVLQRLHAVGRYF